MLPYLHLFNRDIPLYGVMILFGAALAIFCAGRRAAHYDIQKEDVLFMGLYVLIGGMLGAKLLYLLVSLSTILEYVRAIGFMAAAPYILSGGFVFYGGLIGGFLAALRYMFKFKIPFGAMSDVAAPFLPLAHAFGRLGCFFAGCCYGIPVPWGVEFNNSLTAPHNEPLLPMQLIEMTANLVIMCALLLLGRKKRLRGKLIFVYAALYSVIRFALEFFRYDAERGMLWGLSTSQILSIALLAGVMLTMKFPIKSFARTHISDL